MVTLIPDNENEFSTFTVLNRVLNMAGCEVVLTPGEPFTTLSLLSTVAPPNVMELAISLLETREAANKRKAELQPVAAEKEGA